MKAINFLEKARKTDILINNKLIELKQWKEIAKSTVVPISTDKVQTTPKNSTEYAILNYVEIEKEINNYIDKLYKAKTDILNTIEKLPADEYNVLHMIYIQYLDRATIAQSLDRSKSWVNNIHGIAIRHVQTILNNNKKEGTP